jgi:phosphoserine phosphatase
VTRPFFCFDLDGTITKVEILPIISRILGIEEEMKQLTYKTIHGIIPFEESFLLRTQMLKGISTSEVHRAIRGIPLFEEIVSFIQRNNENCALITGNIDVWISPIADILKCRIFSSRGVFSGDEFSHVTHILDKGKVLELAFKDDRHIFAIGDGMGDVALFQNSNTSIAFGGVHEPVESLVKVSDIVMYDEGALCRFLELQL